ncbi:MAG: hypothetical protein R3C49_01020 [Planctomycetaceae bacterium]
MQILFDLQSHCPADCEQQRWSAAIGRTEIAYWNICVTVDDASLPQLKEMKDDIRKLVATTEPSADLLREIYERFGASSPSAARKRNKWRDDFEGFIQLIDYGVPKEPKRGKGAVIWKIYRPY